MEYFGESFFVDVREKMFRLLVITGGIANLCGFICNIFLYGMTGSSVVCGLCFLTIVLLGIIGCTGGRADLAKLFTAVDEKLYQAKNSGKKQIIG